MAIFDNIIARVEQIQALMLLDDETIKYLLKPKRISTAEIEIEGEKILTWRILHNEALGAGKGGIRFHPDVSEDEVKSLSFWMSLKNSLAGLPYGGAKGGAKFNPKGRSKEFLEKVSRAYVDAYYKVIGADKDIPAPDVYTTPEIMGWMLDQYEKKVGHHEPAMITGKPIELGGLKLRGDSTARGGFIIIKELLHHVRNLSKQPTVAIQGFGNAGLNIAKMLYNDGFKIIAVSDSKGGVADSKGLDIQDVIEVKTTKLSVTEYNHNALKITNEELIEMDVDILVLAALENQITSKNASKIKAKYLLELANGPVSNDADELLFKNGKTVIPDILANSGGVIVSYFEWAQNKTGDILDEDYLEQKLFKIMESSWHKVYDLYLEKGNIDLRTSAYIIAIDRIIKAEKARGNLK
ncbi:MAG: Glu/Leu/Phe/Val dehydrogenase [Patescibacteria group bacterium]